MKSAYNPLVGSILLIIGTSVGGGILALPLVVSGLNLFVVLGLLVSIWFVMTLSALYIVELTAHSAEKANLITLAKSTLGKPGVTLTWLSYLLLLYTLISSYLMAGSDLVSGLLQRIAVHSPIWLNTTLFLIFFLAIFYHGIRHIDWANRIFMILKFTSFFLLLVFLIPNASLQNLNFQENSINPVSTIMPIALSFGFALIVPSLHTYLKSYHQLKWATLIGSIFPIVIYFLWILDIHANLNHRELTEIIQSTPMISQFSQAIDTKLQGPVASFVLHLFFSICITTSFLGVSLSFIDFLTDGFKLKTKKTDTHVPIYALILAFAPPFLIVLLNPNIFITTLKFAGTLCVILLILLPTLMIWRACHIKSLIKNKPFYCHGFFFSLNIITAIFLLYLASQDFL